MTAMISSTTKKVRDWIRKIRKNIQVNGWIVTIPRCCSLEAWDKDDVNREK